MRIVLLHNRYRQAGGEDTVVALEQRLLRARGHEVHVFSRDNRTISREGGIRVAAGTIWSMEAARELGELVDAVVPDVVHAHNTFPLMSPSVYTAAERRRVPVVQTLHNYRLVCPAATMFRDGLPCSDCLGRLPWPAVLHACYRDNRKASAVTAAMLSIHRALGTWHDRVDAYVALSEFARRTFVEGGLPEARIHVRPNYVEPPTEDERAARGDGSYGLYVGRLSEEKGVDVAVRAWRELDIPLVVLGEGPLSKVLRNDAPHHVEFAGQVSRDQVRRLMLNAAFLVVPSIWYEGCPMVVLEAFSLGLPVLASDLGSLTELVEEGRNGVRVTPGDATALAEAAGRLAASRSLRAELGEGATDTYFAHYSPERAYRRLMAIYAAVGVESDPPLASIPDTREVSG